MDSSSSMKMVEGAWNRASSNNTWNGESDVRQFINAAIITILLEYHNIVTCICPNGSFKWHPKWITQITQLRIIRNKGLCNFEKFIHFLYTAGSLNNTPCKAIDSPPNIWVSILHTVGTQRFCLHCYDHCCALTQALNNCAFLCWNSTWWTWWWLWALLSSRHCSRQRL